MATLPNFFYVQFEDNKCVAIDTTYYMLNDNNPLYKDIVAGLTADSIKNNLPNNINPDNIYAITWYLNDSGQTGINLKDGSFILFESNEENYNKWCKPYADIWQQIKDQKDQEEAEAEAERNKFENRQARALIQLNADFETVKKRAHIMSSLGFEADANSTANENITGLLLTLGDSETCQFCDYYNQFHELNKTQLTTLQNEIIQNAQNLYNQKWQYRTAIENCTDNDGLDAVIETIEFTYMDFTTE